MSKADRIAETVHLIDRKRADGFFCLTRKHPTAERYVLEIGFRCEDGTAVSQISREFTDREVIQAVADNISDIFSNLFKGDVAKVNMGDKPRAVS